jgi:LacI family transcriptional regulator
MDIIAGPRCETSANDRVRGFLDCLLAHGLPTEGHVFECEHDYDSGVETMRKILSLHKPDAIFTENNLLAYGAFSVIRANGLTVPNDISLACFDASDDFGMMSIAFTTILQPVAEFGRKAVELIVGMNDAQQAYDGPMEIIMEYSFQRGQST